MEYFKINICVGKYFFVSVLIEKLLRTCDVESIYMLIRSKKDDDIHTRVGKIFDDPVSDANESENSATNFINLVISLFYLFAALRSSKKRATEISS
jgi:hypothetical protein